jgi:hypothetical protein
LGLAKVTVKKVRVKYVVMDMQWCGSMRERERERGGERGVLRPRSKLEDGSLKLVHIAMCLWHPVVEL